MRRPLVWVTMLLAGLSATSLPAVAPPVPKPATVTLAAEDPDYRFDRTLGRVISTADVVFPLNNHFVLEGWTGANFAHDGALMRDYGNAYANAGRQFSPVSASQLCYTAHRTFVEKGDAAAGEQVRRQADGLIARSKRAGGGIVWPYRFPNPVFGASAGWISGMGQGEAIACLAGAYSVTGETRYLSAAAKAFAALRARFGDRGTATRVRKGVFYEEVAGAGSEPTHILNGTVFALAGIWMLNEIDPHPGYRRALREGIDGVRSMIRQYEAPGTSLYDLGPRRLAFGRYNLIHVEQLEWLYSLTRDRSFLEAALRFMSFERRLPYRIRASGTVDGVSDQGAFNGRKRRTVTLDISFARATTVDRVELIFPAAWAVPSRVRIAWGGKTIVERPRDRMITIPLRPRRVHTLRVELVPRAMNRTGLALLTISNPETRSLATISSDIAAYRDERSGSRTTLNLLDGRGDTRWFTTARNPWLLVSLGDARYRELVITKCASTDAFAWMFGRDLRQLRSGSPAFTRDAQTTLDVPKGARYLLLEWSGSGGCLADLSGRTTTRL